MNATLEPPALSLELIPGEIPSGTQQRPSVWDQFREQVEALKRTADTLKVVSVDDKHGMALARSTRLAIRQIRLAIEARHKADKAFYLEGGRKVDADKNQLLALTAPIESRMLHLEEFAERETERIEDEQRTARTAELAPYLDGPLAVDLGKMDADSYASMLANSRELYELRQARIRKAEEDRIAQEQADAAERERVRAENEQLKAEAAQREKEAQAERERIEAERKAEREAAETTARLERERLKAESDAREAEAEKERKRLAAEKAESDMKAAALQREADARKAAEERQRKADALAAKKAAAAPDVEKLHTLATAVRGYERPLLANETANIALTEILNRAADDIQVLALKLGGDQLL